MLMLEYLHYECVPAMVCASSTLETTDNKLCLLRICVVVRWAASKSSIFKELVATLFSKVKMNERKLKFYRAKFRGCTFLDMSVFILGKL